MKYTTLALATIFFVGCASLGIYDKPVALENRTLEISRDIAGLKHPYRKCTKMFLGNCRKWELQVDEYDFTDAKVRNKLADMGFVCKIPGKILP